MPDLGDILAALGQAGVAGVGGYQRGQRLQMQEDQQRRLEADADAREKERQRRIREAEEEAKRRRAISEERERELAELAEGLARDDRFTFETPDQAMAAIRNNAESLFRARDEGAPIFPDSMVNALDVPEDVRTAIMDIPPAKRGEFLRTYGPRLSRAPRQATPARPTDPHEIQQRKVKALAASLANAYAGFQDGTVSPGVFYRLRKENPDIFNLAVNEAAGEPGIGERFRSAVIRAAMEEPSPPPGSRHQQVQEALQGAGIDLPSFADILRENTPRPPLR